MLWVKNCMTHCFINDQLFAFGTSCKINYFNDTVRTWTAVKGLPDFDILNYGLFNLNEKILVIKQQRHVENSFIVIILQMQGLEIWGKGKSRNIIFQKHFVTIEALVKMRGIRKKKLSDQQIILIGMLRTKEHLHPNSSQV